MTYAEEAKRIRQEYDRRKKQIPQDYYSDQHPGNQWIYVGRLKYMEAILKQCRTFPLKEKKILEMGCGYGDWLKVFKQWGAEESCFSGIDLDAERLKEAKQRFPAADLRVGEAVKLPWNSESFDIVLQSTVFTSILDADYKKETAKEMLRVLKPSGIILWYDYFYNNPKNPHVKGVRAAEIKDLFAGCRIYLKRVTLAPPLARWLAPKSLKLCGFLEELKFLNTHYLGMIRKNN